MQRLKKKIKKIHSSETTTLIISNEEMSDIMKIVQALEDSNILLNGVTKTIKNETKEQKRGFLSMLWGTLGASLLANLLAGKGIVRAGSDKILSVLSATTGGVSTCSFTSTVGAPVGIASANFTLIFSLTTGITKRVLNITRKKKEKA